ncbi:hypothetical protein [Roseomonas sp. AR75]|uniref:hypothetical protein n=1 Tax=Roseomonas sp. AR75 TaxID=2562311 RepID=UPI0010C05599|nr:hypothetical protein [Roseomonas sp. AR75]
MLAAALLLPAAAVAQDVRFPQVNWSADLGLYGVGTPSATDADREGTSIFLFGEVAAGVHLSPEFSVQGVLALEPIGEGDATGGFPDGGVIGFRRQAAYIEALYADWRPTDGLALQAGRFVAPFARGYHDFPGILTRIRAHEISMIGDSLGVGGTVNLLSDLTFGDVDLSGSVFTLDRTFLSSTFVTSRSCCDPRYERYSRITAAQGGPANNAQFNNFAFALDGDGIAALPGLSWHVAALTRAPGQDGTAREWGYAAALRYLHRWNAEQSTLFFAEGVQFRNGGARPSVEFTTFGTDPDTGDPTEMTETTTLAERQTFITLGAQHRIGPWRGTLAWQRLQTKRSVDAVPTENWIEASFGRALGAGFSADLGYQYARYAPEEGGGLGTAHSILFRLGWTRE